MLDDDGNIQKQGNSKIVRWSDGTYVSSTVVDSANPLDFLCIEISGIL